MSDEEKKAIDYLQLCYDLSTITNESLSKLGIVLNLIEKQSKEIEEINKSDASKEQSSMNYYILYKELVDRIQAKIEEVQNMKAKAKDIVFKSSLNYIETELKSLLEKE